MRPEREVLLPRRSRQAALWGLWSTLRSVSHLTAWNAEEVLHAELDEAAAKVRADVRWEPTVTHLLSLSLSLSLPPRSTKTLACRPLLCPISSLPHLRWTIFRGEEEGGQKAMNDNGGSNGAEEAALTVWGRRRKKTRYKRGLGHSLLLLCRRKLHDVLPRVRRRGGLLRELVLVLWDET